MGSYVLGMGLALENEVLQGICYFLIICYLFVGIAIVSDIFMESIETITAQTRMRTYIDNFGKEMEYEEVVWNPTVANLTLMALGSSAPEILLAVYETLISLDEVPGELGPATIVGSAAFNLLMISAVSVMAVDEVKKIDDMGVFVITSIASLFAYVWIYIVLKVWTPGFVSVVEALLTLFFFFLLVGCSYAADRCRNAGLEKAKSEEEKAELEKEKLRLVAKAYLRRMAGQHGQQFVIECVTGGSFAAEASDEVKSEIRKSYKQVFAITDKSEKQLEDLGLNELITALEADNLIERITHRKQAGTSEKKQYIKLKGTHQQLEHKQDHNMTLNPRIGFKCTHYSVTESSGFVEVTIVKKIQEDMLFFVRTVDDTAKAPADYEHFEQLITLRKNEKSTTIKVKVVDDMIWEPDKDFAIEICESEKGERMEGDDTRCVVTILDEDQPGILGFENKAIKVRKKDKFAYVKVVRTEGADGEISCWVKTQVMNEVTNHAAEFTDFLPVDEKLTFGHCETDKMVKIELSQTAQIDGVEEETKKEDDDSKANDSESSDEEESMLVFQLKLENPEPTGTKLSKKTSCHIQIVSDSVESTKEDRMQQKMLEYILQQKEATWAQQFKFAIMLGPSIDEDNNMEEIEGKEAIIHFFSIGWNVLFALIPPRRYGGGSFAFFTALAFIGLCTAIVAEFAGLLGCAIGLKESVTAITLVALGTSLPDTLASKISAQNSDNADAAIGNITGSNSVNVFLGLGLPWTFATIYRKSKTGEDYEVPSGELAYSVMLFLIVAVICFIILFSRRRVSFSKS